MTDCIFHGGCASYTHRCLQLVSFRCLETNWRGQRLFIGWYPVIITQRNKRSFVHLRHLSSTRSCQMFDYYVDKIIRKGSRKSSIATWIAFSERGLTKCFRFGDYRPCSRVWRGGIQVSSPVSPFFF